jgi:DNA-binding MarR family transcriptional regulator
VAAVRALARAARLLERSTGELTLAQYRVLSAVASGDERASRIAQRLAVGKPTVSAAVDALSQRGLLSRSGVAHDQRAAALALTDLGAEVLHDVETRMCERIDDLARRTDDPDRLLATLAGLGAAIDDLVAERAGERAAGVVAG